jgi:UDP-N-acetylmuramate--alanine ligase
MSSLTPEQVTALLREQPGATVHLVGAGGCGMSGLAHLLLDAGHRVVGSDVAANEEIAQLRERGAMVHMGHRAEQVEAARPVLVVYSSAIRADNPEIVAAEQLAIPAVRRAVLLAAFMHRQRGICVAGMHGKTTTSALLAWALTRVGANPGYAIGALVPQIAPHARFTGTGYFVAEADESDGTLREFRPEHSILLNVDSDHLDYFGDLPAVCREFRQFAANTSGTIVFCADDSRVAEIMSTQPRGVSYGFNALADYRIERVENSAPQRADAHFKVWHQGFVFGEFSIALLGEKNVLNAGAVIALLHQLGFEALAIAQAMDGFRGAARRQQEIYSGNEVRVFDDYGHHPNEIRATLRALRQLNPERLVVAFQPHRYTRTLHLMQEFAAAFADADALFLTDVYAASEDPVPGATSGALAEAIRAQGQDVDYVPRLDAVADAVHAVLRRGDVVLFLGAGDITKAAHDFSNELRKGCRQVAPRAQSKGMSNATSGNRMASDSGRAAVLEKLRASISPSTTVRADEPLAKRTTLRVGGKADFFAEPASEQDLAQLLRACAELRLPFTVIGRGSNLLIRDGGIRGMVIGLGHEAFSQVKIVGEHFHCGAGAKLKTISVEARRAGLAGLEFLEGIPGSVGGALRMNAGAMGSWMFEAVEQIRFMDFSGNVQERKASEVNVEYRGCPLFKTHIALGAILRASPAPKEVIQERARQFNAKRWESQPAQPSAGCIFKNPKAVPAGKLIDELGLKGTKRGGAMISTVHGNFIVNEGKATAKDVLELIDFVKETARTRRGIELETEVEILGE